MRAALDRGAISAEELLASHRQRIAQWNPRVNAFSEQFETSTGSSGALAGIPITIKDSLDVAGHATVCGVEARKQHRASQDATCVKRLKQVGAVLLGKTNTPELLMNWETFSTTTGVTRNPWNVERTAGGSSGGESAAIASCMSAGGIGSDGGGSIRLPAALTGICGLKPTPGRVPASGHFPTVGHPGGLLGVIGPMARTVEDVEILFRVVAGHDDRDPFSIPFVPAGALTPQLVGIVDSDVTRMALKHVDAEVTDFGKQPWDRMFEVWRFFFLRVNAHAIGYPTPHTAAYLDKPAPTMMEMLEMLAARDALRARFLQAMDDMPIVLMPNPGLGAWKCGEFPGVESMAPLTVANLLGLPALSIPVGLDADGMPLAIQAVAKPWQEEMLLDFGKRFEKQRGSFPLPGTGGQA